MRSFEELEDPNEIETKRLFHIIKDDILKYILNTFYINKQKNQCIICPDPNKDDIIIKIDDVWKLYKLEDTKTDIVYKAFDAFSKCLRCIPDYHEMSITLFIIKRQEIPKEIIKQILSRNIKLIENSF